MPRVHGGRLSAPGESWSPALRPPLPPAPHPQGGPRLPAPLLPRGRATGAAPHPTAWPRAASPTDTWHRDPSPRSATGASFRTDVLPPNSKSYLTSPRKAPGRVSAQTTQSHPYSSAPPPTRAVPGPQPGPIHGRRMLWRVLSEIRVRGRLGKRGPAPERRGRDGPVSGDRAPGE